MVAEQGFVSVSVHRASGMELSPPEEDELAIEEPLEIRISHGPRTQRAQRSISVTMRTPGHDGELAVGFLLAEGILHHTGEIQALHSCGLPLVSERARNIVHVELRPDVSIDLQRLERHFYTTSSCGVCGKASLEALQMVPVAPLSEEGPIVAAAVIQGLPDRLRTAQAVFDRTGGLHASALFDRDGNLLLLREDVGRHNALDKLIGAQLLAQRLPLADYVLLVSGRASFELVQKALMAGIPILAAVGAPSSLAVALAKQFQMTLAGFVRNGRFNIYSGAWRIRGSQSTVGTRFVQENMPNTREQP